MPGCLRTPEGQFLGPLVAAGPPTQHDLPHTWSLGGQQLQAVFQGRDLATYREPVTLRYQVLTQSTPELGDRLLAILSELKLCNSIAAPLEAQDFVTQCSPDDESQARWDGLLGAWHDVFRATRRRVARHARTHFNARLRRPLTQGDPFHGATEIRR